MILSRRSTLVGTAALGLAGVGTRPADAAEPLESQVVIRTTGGVFEAALKRNFFDPFTKATGVRVVPVAASYGDMMAKSAAMQAAGRVEWDIISPQYNELSQIQSHLVDLGDCGAMPNVAKEGVANACGRYGVLYLTGGQVLTWSTQAYKDRKPRSWADFWDTSAFPGRRALPNTGSPWATLMLALLADGVPRSANVEYYARIVSCFRSIWTAPSPSWTGSSPRSRRGGARATRAGRCGRATRSRCR